MVSLKVIETAALSILVLAQAAALYVGVRGILASRRSSSCTCYECNRTDRIGPIDPHMAHCACSACAHSTRHPLL